MDLAAQRAALDAMFGPASGDLDVELWVGDPDSGSQVTGPGYAPGLVPAAGWEPASTDGVKRASAAADCGTPTDAWSGTVTHFALRDTGGALWFSARLSTPLDVGGPGSAVAVLPGVFFADSLNGVD